MVEGVLTIPFGGVSPNSTIQSLPPPLGYCVMSELYKYRNKDHYHQPKSQPSRGKAKRELLLTEWVDARLPTELEEGAHDRDQYKD